jgi:hypothetical protein
MRTTSIPSNHGTFTSHLHINTYTGHAGAVTALLRDSEAIGPSEETDGFVP